MTETIYEKLDQIEQEVVPVEPLDQDLDALTYLQMVYRGQIQAEGPRMRAAMACLQFERPKLAVVASVNDPSAFAERLERAIARSGVRPPLIEHAPAAPRVIEPPQTNLAKPMTTSVPDRRMRRV